MARESKRTRDERRFGKSRMLADRILGTNSHKDVALPEFALENPKPEHLDLYAEAFYTIKHALSSCPVIDAGNGCRVYWDHPQDTWHWADFPNITPPFLAFFVETGHPGTIIVANGRTAKPADWCPQRWGFLFESYEVSEGEKLPVYDDKLGLRDEVIPGARWTMRSYTITSSERKLMFYPIQAFFVIDGSGQITGDPVIMSGGEPDEEAKAAIVSYWTSLLKPILFAISFMHCKNVTIPIVEPNRATNRERREAGLKPFVRYNTIDIEPMKKVLRTEGNIETEGLKRALHICRGHFSTYTEEKPLFGRVAGTFWVPAHVRGSAKKGVVISDYNVKGPQNVTS